MDETEQFALCEFEGGPMDGDMMYIPADVDSISVAEPMQLVCAPDDAVADEVIFLDNLYILIGICDNGHRVFEYQPHHSL